MSRELVNAPGQPVSASCHSAGHLHTRLFLECLEAGEKLKCTVTCLQCFAKHTPSSFSLLPDLWRVNRNDDVELSRTGKVMCSAAIHLELHGLKSRISLQCKQAQPKTGWQNMPAFSSCPSVEVKESEAHIANTALLPADQDP